MKNWQRTRRQYLTNLYSHMLERVTNPAKSIDGRSYLGLPICTREEFISFGLDSRRFNLLFKKYKRSKGLRAIAPSIDRVNNKKGYILSNMQFLTVGQNSLKDRKIKWIVLKSPAKKVFRFSSTTEVAKFLKHKREVKITRKSFTNLKTGERFTNLTNPRNKPTLFKRVGL